MLLNSPDLQVALYVWVVLLTENTPKSVEGQMDSKNINANEI